MKRLLIILLAVGFLMSCNNNKGKGGLFGGLGGNKNTNRTKDDYGNNNNGNNGNNGNGNNGDNNNKGGGSWSNTDRNSFLEQCQNSMPDNPQQAKQLCSCVLEKLEKEYTDLNDADSRGGEEAGRRLAQECAYGNRTLPGGGGDDNGGKTDDGGGIGGSWSNSDRRNFVNDCTSTAEKGGMTQSQAESYCSCMEEKLEHIYPSAKDANRLTAADMETPQMKQMVHECLGMDN